MTNLSNMHAKTSTSTFTSTNLSSLLQWADPDHFIQRKLAVSDQDQLEVCYPDQQWIDYDDTSYIFQRERYNTKCVDRQQRPFEYGAFMGYYTTGEPCANACVKGDNTSQLKGCYPQDR